MQGSSQHSIAPNRTQTVSANFGSALTQTAFTATQPMSSESNFRKPAKHLINDRQMSFFHRQVEKDKEDSYTSRLEEAWSLIQRIKQASTEAKALETILNAHFSDEDAEANYADSIKNGFSLDAKLQKLQSHNKDLRQQVSSWTAAQNKQSTGQGRYLNGDHRDKRTGVGFGSNYKLPGKSDKDNGKTVLMSREHIRQEMRKLQKSLDVVNQARDSHANSNDNCYTDKKPHLESQPRPLGQERVQLLIGADIDCLHKELSEAQNRYIANLDNFDALKEKIAGLKAEASRLKQLEVEQSSASAKKKDLLAEYTDSETRLQALRSKEVLLSAKIAELEQNPLFRGKSQGLEIDDKIGLKEKELLELKSQNNKLQLLCRDQEFEIKELGGKVNEVKSAVDAKQRKIEDLANLHTKINIKEKFSEFVAECGRDEAGGSTDELYRLLLDSLQEINLKGNPSEAVKDLLKQKQSLLKSLGDFDFNGSDQSTVQILLHSLRLELINVNNELERHRAQQKRHKEPLRAIQPLLSHLNKLKAIYSYLSSMRQGTKTFDQLIADKIPPMGQQRAEGPTATFDSLPSQSTNHVIFLFKDYHLDFNKMLIDPSSEFQLIFTLKHMGSEAAIFSGKSKQAVDINIEQPFELSVYGKLDVVRAMQQHLVFVVELEQGGRRRPVGRSQVSLKALFLKYADAVQRKDEALGSRTIDVTAPIYFSDKDCSPASERGLLSCKLAFKNLFSDYINSFLVAEFASVKMHTLVFRLDSGFGFDPFGKFRVAVRVPKRNSTHVKLPGNQPTKVTVTEEAHSYQCTSGSKTGPNPFFQMEFELEIDTGPQFQPFLVEVTVFDINKEPGAKPTQVGATKISIPHSIASNKLIKEVVVESFESNLPHGRESKSSLLVAVCNKNNHKSDIKLYDAVYSKKWFLGTTLTISKAISTKFKRKELLMEHVFSKEKVNILPGEFLSAIFNLSEAQIECHPVKASIESEDDLRTVFANKFEFLLYWKYLVHSERFWEFFKEEMEAASRNAQLPLPKPEVSIRGQLARLKQFELAEKNFITNNHFKFVYFELQKEKPSTLSLLDKIKEAQPEAVVGNTASPTPANGSLEPPQSFSLPELISSIQAKIKEYKRQNKLSDCDLILMFDKNNDGLMQKEEFRNCLAELSVNIKSSELDFLFNLLDKDGSGSLTIIEIMKFLELEPRDILRPSSHDKYFAEKYQVFKGDRVYKDYINAVHRFLRANDFTYFQFFDKCKLIDGKSKDVSSISLPKFIDITRNTLGLKDIKSGDLDLIFKKIDKDASGSLSFDEFCDFLDLKKIFEVVENSEFAVEIESSVFLEAVWAFAAKFKMTLEQLFAEIDDDKNGELSKKEMFVYFRNLFNANKRHFDVKEFEGFLNLLSKGGKECIHFEDIKKVLAAYEVHKRTPRQVPRAFFDDLLLKLRDIIRTGRFRLKVSFECEEEEKGLILLEKFRGVLEDSNKFTEEEIQAVINPIALPFTKFERVNYENFLNLCDYYEGELREIERSRDTSVVKVFKILKDISQKYNYDKYLLFSLMDKHNAGFITADTMCEVFKDIGLEFDESPIRNAFKLIDTSEDGKIDMREFVAFMDEIK